MTPRAVSLGLIVVSFLSGPLLVEVMRFDDKAPALSFVIAVPSFVAFGVILTCFMADLAEDPGRVWQRPSLGNSSFVSVMKQPLQVFAMNAHVMLAFAAGSMVYAFVLVERRWEWVLFSCVAIGIYFGLYLAARIFKERIIL